MNIIADTRQDTFTFPANSTQELLCIPHEDDESICEEEITGTIELDRNGAVQVSDPHSATVTIQDDDSKPFIAALFVAY